MVASAAILNAAKVSMGLKRKPDSKMHPNHTPKKFPIGEDRLPFLVGPVNHCTHRDGNDLDELDRESAWKTIMCPTRMDKDRPAWNFIRIRQNSKTATDIWAHGSHYYRSWRNLIDGKKANALALAIQEGT